MGRTRQISTRLTEAEHGHLRLIAGLHGITGQALIVRLIGVGLSVLEAECAACPAMPPGSFDGVELAHGGDSETARKSGGIEGSGTL